MIGSGVLLECLDDSRVGSVISIRRRAGAVAHPKLREIVRSDFHDFSDIVGELADRDACFFCLGVSSVGMSEADYGRLTYGVTVALGAALADARPGAVFCFVSGAGTDNTGEGRSMWARVKGKAENALLDMRLDTYIFRPGFIQPLRGVRSRTALYQAFYNVTGPAIPVLRRFFPNLITTTVNVGRAMINVAEAGFPKRILENRDINVASRSS